MKNGDFIYIDYVGRIKETGEIFDLTKEDVARKEGIYDPKFKYKPIPVVVGSDLVIKGLNKVLKEMKVGEKRKVEIGPEEGFGERMEELVKIIPESVFKDQNIEPVPGYYVNIGGLRGRIISVSGGRVKVDFNHPLAGKTLEYEIEIVREVKNEDEKIKSIVCYFTGMDEDEVNLQIKEKIAEISFKNQIDLPLRVKNLISKKIFEWIKDVEEIKFVESFKRT